MHLDPLAHYLLPQYCLNVDHHKRDFGVGRGAGDNLSVNLFDYGTFYEKRLST